MAGSIGVPASSLDIRLGQSPNIPDPKMNAELQGVYNAIHILNAYTEALRQELEGTDSQVPSESLRFRKRFSTIALQPITAGNVVAPYGNGVVNGLQTTPHAWDPRFFWNPNQLPNIPPRGRYAQLPRVPMVALTSAGVNQTISVGVPPGIVQLPGAKCGQLVWAMDYMNVLTFHGALNGNRTHNGVHSIQLNGVGGLYTSIPPIAATLGPSGYYRGGDYWFLNMVTLWPVAVGVADNYIMFRDFLNDGLQGMT